MKRVLILGVVVLMIAVGGTAYAFLKPPQEASGPIEAIPIAVEQPASEGPTQAVDGAEQESRNVPAPEATATETPEYSETPAVEAPGSDTTSGAAPVVFSIVQAGSEVRFFINEVLNNAPKTVIGATDQVAGEIAVYPSDPPNSIVGPILINARTLTTDNDFRNRAIKNRILNTNAYEFITFAPTEILGLPNEVTIGQEISFQIVGDLTVRDVTNKVTFDVTITPLSETQLQGIASTTILYRDYSLTIPSAPAVASVEDEVILEIEFVAAAR